MDVDPIFVEVKDAARILAVTPWTVYDLLNREKIEKRYQGRKVLVSYASLKAYADQLPTTAPAKEEASA